MNFVPEEVKNLTHESTLIEGGIRKTSYTLNKGEKDSHTVNIDLPYFKRPEKSLEVITDTNTYKNGYKVVIMGNHEYAYVRESDGALMPYRYDVATDFNEYGYALVGKDSFVSLIDKDFKYLNNAGKLVKEDLENPYARFNGWTQINNFSKGEIPLARVCDTSAVNAHVCYCGIDGELQEFMHYGESEKEHIRKIFNQGTTFDENDQALASGNLLFADGFYLTFNDLIDICSHNNILDNINHAEKKTLERRIIGNYSNTLRK